MTIRHYSDFIETITHDLWFSFWEQIFVVKEGIWSDRIEHHSSRGSMFPVKGLANLCAALAFPVQGTQ